MKTPAHRWIVVAAIISVSAGLHSLGQVWAGGMNHMIDRIAKHGLVSDFIEPVCVTLAYVVWQWRQKTGNSLSPCTFGRA